MNSNLASEFVKQAISNKIYEPQYLQLIKDLVTAIGKGVPGVTNDSIGFFNYIIQGLENGSGDARNYLAQVTALLRLQETCLE